MNNKLTLEQRLSLLENKIRNLDSMTRERVNKYKDKFFEDDNDNNKSNDNDNNKSDDNKSKNASPISFEDIQRLYRSIINNQGTSILDSLIKSLIKRQNSGTELYLLLLLLLKAISIENNK